MFFTGNDPSDCSDSDEYSRDRHLQNLEDFEANALKDESASLRANSIPADALMLRQEGSSSIKEFTFSPCSNAQSKLASRPRPPNLADTLGSLNDDSQSLLKQDVVENSAHSVKSALYDKSFAPDSFTKDGFNFDTNGSNADGGGEAIPTRDKEARGILQIRKIASKDRKFSFVKKNSFVDV